VAEGTLIKSHKMEKEGMKMNIDENHLLESLSLLKCLGEIGPLLSARSYCYYPFQSSSSSLTPPQFLLLCYNFHVIQDKHITVFPESHSKCSGVFR
jgi:hypothetical protein